MTTITNTTTGKEHAIVGIAEDGIGTHGTSSTSTGAGGVSKTGVGVHGVSTAGPGVRGDAENGVGVFGASKTSTGTSGLSESAIGVHGVSTSGQGVVGVSKSGAGVSATSETSEGAHVECNASGVAAVAAYARNPEGTGAALYAEKAGDVGHAGFFVGDVHITKTLTVELDVRLAGADLAEAFDSSSPLEPGSVVVFQNDHEVGVTDIEYDRRLAGVVSGAESYKPAIILNGVESDEGFLSLPVALGGRVWCKAEANSAPIELGDLLTSSSIPGYAMRATDRDRALGSILGKSLGALEEGLGMVPMFVNLR